MGRLTRERIIAIVTTLCNIGIVLENADPAYKTRLYGQPGQGLAL
jgi:hypothetical protein